MKKCDCNERYGIQIYSMVMFKELKLFFENQEKDGIFKSIEVVKPYHIGYSETNEKFCWYATKWYVCNCCNCLWEFQYPEFPANGFVRKFEDGVYRPQE